MKHPDPILAPWLRAVVLPLAAALVLLATAGCGGSAPWPSSGPTGRDWQTSHEYLENKIDRIRMQVERDHGHAEKAEFWRVIAALLFLLVFLALVGGAALGSRARRDSLAYHEPCEADPTDAPEPR